MARRRRGGGAPATTPYNYTVQALGRIVKGRRRLSVTWKVSGVAGKSWAKLTLLKSGPMAELLRDPQLYGRFLGLAHAHILRQTPVRSGQLRRSTRMTGSRAHGSIEQGPRPWVDRTGRWYARGSRHKWYARWANQRSRNPRYMEKSLRLASLQGMREVNRILAAEAEAEAEERRLTAVLAGRRR